MHGSAGSPPPLLVGLSSAVDLRMAQIPAACGRPTASFSSRAKKPSPGTRDEAGGPLCRARRRSWRVRATNAVDLAPRLLRSAAVEAAEDDLRQRLTERAKEAAGVHSRPFSETAHRRHNRVRRLLDSSQNEGAPAPWTRAASRPATILRATDRRTQALRPLHELFESRARPVATEPSAPPKVRPERA